jgi:phosphoribosylaminoimidazole-succinocarboxamide synthase
MLELDIKKNQDPSIPALPDEVIQQTAELYASMYERLTGTEF